MALISRFSRLLRADLHAVLDHLEEPDVLLRQAVREMEEALAADGARLKRLRLEHEQLARREQDLRRAIGNIDAELDVCFEAGEHDLARSLCRRKLETEQLIEAAARRRETTARELEALEQSHRDQQIRYESMRQKSELFAAEAREPGEGGHEDACVAVDDVEVAFLREQRKRRAP